MSRVFCELTYNGNMAEVTSMVPTSDFHEELRPLDVLGFGDEMFFLRPCQIPVRGRMAFRLTAIPLSPAETKIPPVEMPKERARALAVLYDRKKETHGQILAPGYGLFATDEFSAATGMWHRKTPACYTFLDGVVLALALPPQTIKRYTYLNILSSCGERDVAGVGVVKHHFATDGSVIEVPLESQRGKTGPGVMDTEMDPHQMRVMDGTFLVNWNTQPDGTQHLTRVIITEEADADAVGREIAEIFQLPDISGLMKICRRVSPPTPPRPKSSKPVDPKAKERALDILSERKGRRAPKREGTKRRRRRRSAHGTAKAAALEVLSEAASVAFVDEADAAPMQTLLTPEDHAALQATIVVEEEFVAPPPAETPEEHRIQQEAQAVTEEV